MSNFLDELNTLITTLKPKNNVFSPYTTPAQPLVTTPKPFLSGINEKANSNKQTLSANASAFKEDLKTVFPGVFERAGAIQQSIQQKSLEPIKQSFATENKEMFVQPGDTFEVMADKAARLAWGVAGAAPEDISGKFIAPKVVKDITPEFVPHEGSPAPSAPIREVSLVGGKIPESPISTTLTRLFQEPEPIKPLEPVNKVEYKISGTTDKERIASAKANSESANNSIRAKGQEAYEAGIKLSPTDMKLIEEYDKGVPVNELIPQAEDPKAFETYMKKSTDYYDYRLAADRASGGETNMISSYIPHELDLSKPSDLDRFNKYALQKGLKPYEGFRSQPRVFGTYQEAEQYGFKRANPNPVEDLKSDYEKASSAISKQVLRKGLNEAVPKKITSEGFGRTSTGKPFLNSNISGLQGLAMDPSVARELKGYEPLTHPDFVKMVIKDGAESVTEKTGIGAALDKITTGLKSVPKNAEEAGFSGTLGSLYDHVSSPLKQILWNWSGFHSLNITLSHMGQSLFHPITGTKGVLQSLGSIWSERIYQASLNNYKNILVTDSLGKSKSVYDWALESGAFQARDLPKTGLGKFNPFTFGKEAIFGREIPILQLNLAEQAAKKGFVANSVEGIEIGKEIRAVTGEINTKTMNINPNTLKLGSRLLLAPGFTYSKFKTVFDAVFKWGGSKGEAGNLARTAVVGKSFLVGAFVIISSLIATGKFPKLEQILKDFTIDPSIQTNITNTKGQKKDITLPKTFVSEAAGLFTDPVHYVIARMAPLISDAVKLETNQDYYGNPIVDPNVKESATTQIAKNIGVGHLPIGAQAVEKLATGKQDLTEAGIQIAGGGTRINADDPTKVYYKAIDDAATAIAKIAPDDPERVSKMQTIFNNLTVAQRKTLNYQELLAGVSTKGVLTSAAGRLKPLYDELQVMKANGQTTEANAIWEKLSPVDKTLYAKVKTYYKSTATTQAEKDFQPTYASIRDKKTSGDPELEAQADAEYAELTPKEKKYYQSLKKQSE